MPYFAYHPLETRSVVSLRFHLCRVCGGKMFRQPKLNGLLVCAAAAIFIAGCQAGATSNGSFDRTYTVSGPIRLDLSNASGSVRISSASGNTVHIHGEIHARGFFFNNPQKQASDFSANPPIEQKPDVIRVGKDLSTLNR